MSIRLFCLSAAFVAIALSFLNLADGSNYRIVSGRKVTALEFPYQAGLERLTRHWCGGSIIHSNWILTAAHCVNAYAALEPVHPYILRVRVGNDISGEGGTVYLIDKIIPHENYTDTAEMDTHDIALLRTTSPIVFGDRVKMVKLVQEKPEAGTMGWVSGFGKQEVMRSGFGRRNLMAVEVPVVDLKKCRSILRNVASDMICAGHRKGNRDSCTGDSGGPYVVKNQQAGIVAWGVGCGREGLPGVYTNIAYYRQWIASKLFADGDTLGQPFQEGAYF